MLSPASVDVEDRTRVEIATADAGSSKVIRRSRVTLRTRIGSATGRSTSATDTQVRYDTTRNCVADTLNI